MKTSYKKLISLIISLVLIVSLLAFFSTKLKQYVKSNHNSSISKLYNDDIKDKGSLLLNSSLENDDILLFGSSELSSPVEQNARLLFPNTTSDKVLTVTGAPHVQSLLTSIKLGSLNLSPDSNIVIIVSPQWFMTKEIDADGFNSNFSKLQYYKLLENDNLSDELKEKISNRTAKITSGYSENFDINLISRAYDRTLIYSAFSPFKKSSELASSFKDDYVSAKLTKKEHDYYRPPTADIDWNDMKIVADAQGKAAITNSLMVEDDYYDKYIVPNLDELKGKDSNVNLFDSNEFIDFEILLDTCAELNIKPYFIFASTNGYFYDYTGLPKEHRDEYYEKVSEMTREYNFDYLDLKDYEYEKYFYYDAMHLGWKGWLYISEEVSKHFK